MAVRRIDSPHNQEIKRLVRLRERRQRDREGRFLIEGVREVERALQGGVELLGLYLAPELLSPAARPIVEGAAMAGTPVTHLSAAAFDRLSLRENPDGLLGLAATWRTDPDRLELPPDALTLVLDGLEKPGNLGALLRTADAVGADAVFVTGAGTDLFNPNVVRASMGSVFTLPVLALPAPELRELLKRAGMTVLATSPAAERSYWDVDYLGPTAVVLGTEHEGLDPAWLGEAAERVSVPMRGQANSLNVATTGALLLDEALRQRRAARDGAGGGAR